MIPFSGAKLVLTCKGSLLTYLRDDYDHIPWPGHWDLPGGGAESHEVPVTCALRELYEEFGLRLPPARLIAQRFDSVTRAGWDSWMFAGPITPAEIAAIRFGDEGQEWRMMPVAEFLAHPRVVPHFPARVEAVLGLRPPRVL